VYAKDKRFYGGILMDQLKRILLLSFIYFSFISGSTAVRNVFYEYLLKNKRQELSKHVVKISGAKAEEIKTMVINLAKKAHINSPEICITSLGGCNAEVIGDAENSLLVIGNDLIKSLNKDELEGFLAHEIGHLKQDHHFKGVKRFFTFFSLQLLALFVTIKTTKWVDGSVKNVTLKNIFEWCNCLLLVPHVLYLSYMERQGELEADQASVVLTKHTYMAQALRKMNSKQEISPSMWRQIKNILRSFFRTHPLIEERIRLIEKS